MILANEKWNPDPVHQVKGANFTVTHVRTRMEGSRMDADGATLTVEYLRVQLPFCLTVDYARAPECLTVFDGLLGICGVCRLVGTFLVRFRMCVDSDRTPGKLAFRERPRPCHLRHQSFGARW